MCVDLDGTLIKFHSQLFPHSVNTLNKFMIINDAEVIIVTGRSLFSTRAVVKRLNEQLVNSIRYAVCFNGAMVFDFEREIVLQETHIDGDSSKKLFQFCNLNKLVFWGYPRFLPDRNTYVIVNKIPVTSLMSVFKRKFVKYMDCWDDYREFQKIVVFATKRRLQKLELLKKIFADQIEICHSDKNVLELTKLHTSKASGVSFLKQKFGLNLNQFASIGNSMNDLPMFSQSGFNIAMYTSPPELKKHADFVASKRWKTAFGDAIDQLINYK